MAIVDKNARKDMRNRNNQSQYEQDTKDSRWYAKDFWTTYHSVADPDNEDELAVDEPSALDLPPTGAIVDYDPITIGRLYSPQVDEFDPVSPGFILESIKLLRGARERDAKPSAPSPQSDLLIDSNINKGETPA